MITLSTGTLFPYGLNRIFEIAKEAGYTGLELMARPMNFGEHKDAGFWDCWDVGYIKSLEEKYGVRIETLHTQPDFEDNPYSHWSRTVHLADKLGVKYVVCHIPYLQNVTYEKWFKEIYLGRKPYPFTLLAENLPNKDGNRQMIYETNQWQNFPAICFDTNHALASNQNVLEIIKNTANIKQFHISHFDGEHEHQSILKNKELFKEILTIKKIGYYCVEMYYSSLADYRDASQTIEELGKIRQFIETIIKT